MSIYTRAEDVSNEIARRIARINTASGYETDIGDRFFKGRRKLPGDDEPPCSMLIEGNDSPTDQPGRMASVLIKQAYVVWGFDKCDPDNPNDKAHAMIRDIKSSLFKDGASLGNMVKEVTYLGRDIGPRPDGAALVQVEVAFAVTYVEQLAQP